MMYVSNDLHELLCPFLVSFIRPSYLACHIADCCVVAAVLLGCKQALTGWLSYGCFPLTYCKCSLLPPVLSHSSPSPSLLLPPPPLLLLLLLSPVFRAGLQMSGFPKVSSLPVYDCTLLLLPVVIFVVALVVEQSAGRYNCYSTNTHAFLSL